MPVRRDTRTGGWYFRTTVKLPDGTRRRIFGTPGVPGPFQDLAASKVGAQEAERRAIAELMTGKPARGATSEPKEETPTIEEYSKTFLEHYKPEQKPSERRAKRRIINNHLVPHLGHLRLDEIRQEHVDAFAAAQLKRCKAKTVNNRLSVLSSLIKYAVANRLVDKPSAKFIIDSMDGELVAVPIAGVERLVAAASDPILRVAVLLASEAGLRAGELRGAQWTDVKEGQLTIRRALDTNSINVIPPKHNKARTVPLSERIVAELKMLPRRGLWILSRPDGRPLTHDQIYKPLVALYTSAGVAQPPKVIHCLRHTFGTELAGRGVPLPVIQELMGHAKIDTTRRYIHVNEQQKREAIADAFGRGSHVAAKRKRRRD
jgi:integrase